MSRRRPVTGIKAGQRRSRRPRHWAKKHCVRRYAMESGCLYWIPVYQLFEQREFKIILANARWAKNMPERKTDVSGLHDCASCIPGACSAQLPARCRYRDVTHLSSRQREHSEYAAAHIQDMQKVPLEMNLQFHYFVLRSRARTECGLSGLTSQVSAILTCWRLTMTCVAIPASDHSRCTG